MDGRAHHGDGKTESRLQGALLPVPVATIRAHREEEVTSHFYYLTLIEGACRLSPNTPLTKSKLFDLNEISSEQGNRIYSIETRVSPQLIPKPRRGPKVDEYRLSDIELNSCVLRIHTIQTFCGLATLDCLPCGTEAMCACVSMTLFVWVLGGDIC